MKILPLFIPHQGCPFACIYCNQHHITHTQKDTCVHFSALIKGFCNINTQTDKEIAFFGGTFTALPNELQELYISLINPWISQIRGIRISTRPDCIDQHILNKLKQQKISTIELGIQSFDDKVLDATRRGYGRQTALDNCKLIIDNGFDLIIQLMPGLPDDNMNIFIESITTAVELKPAGIRLYPTVVLADTALAAWYKEGKYTPLSLEETLTWLKRAWKICQKAQVPVIKTGLHSDIDPQNIIAGPYHPTIGELLKIELLADRLTAEWKQDLVLYLPHKYKSLFLGHGKSLIKKLKNNLLLDKIPVHINKEKNENEIGFRAGEAQLFW